MKADKAELTIVRLSHFNFFLLPLAILARIKDRLTKRSVPTGGDVPAAPVNRFLTTVFKSESLLLKRTNLPIGLSLMSVLEVA